MAQVQSSHSLLLLSSPSAGAMTRTLPNLTHEPSLAVGVSGWRLSILSPLMDMATLYLSFVSFALIEFSMVI